MTSVNRERILDDIADAILDGTPLDWSVAETGDAPVEKALVDQLRTLAAVRAMVRASVSPHTAAETWGHLRLFERVGQGAFGEVYRAWDTRLDREVALKLLPAGSGSDAPSGSAVIQEGRLLARVRHANVATIYGAERIDGRVGIWMEFVKGRTLEERLRSERTIAAPEVTRLGVTLCQAVAAVHAAGLLHRDIKAQNIMLEDDGRLVLMDFGTGRELGDVTDRHVAGTPLYLAPEVLGGAAATPQSDVYGIGVVLFRLLTGTYPVSATDLAGLHGAHAGGVDLGSCLDRPEIPLRLRRVLARALDPDPARRYATADALGAALGKVQRSPAARRVPWLIASAAALVALAAAGWNLGLRERLSPASPSIAVLPFRNASSDPGSDDFIDGLTSEVIRNLAAIDGLQVRSQTSSFYFKNRQYDLRDVKKQLNVDLVVEASVQRAGNRLRITAQLVKASDDVPLWSESFDGGLDDVFSIQEKIARAIVNKLRLTLGRGQRRYRTSLAAYDLYLQGRAAVARGGNDSGQAAARLFEQVIALDPNYVPALAGLVNAYAAMSWQLDGMLPNDAIARMRPAAIKALELDPLLADAHAAMGITYARELDWDNAAKSFQQAINLHSNDTQIYADYALSTLLPTGRAREAEDLLANARLQDPLSLALQRDLAIVQFVRGRYDEAISNLQQVIARDRNFQFAANMLSRSLTFAGRPEEAIALFKSMGRPGWERWLTTAYVRTGRRDDVERLLAAHQNEEPYRQALVYAAVGDKERTLEALKGAVETRPQRTAFVLVAPEMAFLRGDPRLEELRRRLNLR